MLARFRATLLLLFDLAILFLLHHPLLIYKSAATAFEINPSSFRYRTHQTIRSSGLRPTTMTIASSASKEPIALAVPPLKESKKSIKAVLFDMDGTLLDTERLSDKALLMALFGKQKECTVDDLPLLPESLQKPPTSDWILPWTLKRQILGLRGKEWAPICLDFAREHEDDLPTVEELIDRWEKNLSALCSEVEACDGAKVLIRNIIGCGDFKIPMAIATSSRMSGVEKKRIRHERHMFEHIDTIVTGDDPAVQNGKPAPDIYVEAARRLDVDPSECLVFEDALSGVKAGKAAGCQVVVIPDTRFTEDERIKLFVDEGGADVVLSSLWEFDGRPFGMDFDMNEISRMEEQKDK